MAIPEMLEWPKDAEWLSEHRKKRFESLEDCREYLKYQFSEYMEDEKYIKTAISIWGYIYEKGYLVPLEFLERFKEKDAKRRMNIKSRRERRNRVRSEYKRWHVHFREKFSTNIPYRCIIRVYDLYNKLELYEKLIELFGLYRIYMYNPTGKPSGMRYYSGEPVVLIETSKYKTENALNCIRSRIEKMSVEAYIVVIDTVGLLDIKGYKEVSIGQFIFPTDPDFIADCYQDPYEYE